MDNNVSLPTYVGSDKISVKKYKNVYKDIVYNREPFKSLLEKLSIDLDKLHKDSELYFSGNLSGSVSVSGSVSGSVPSESVIGKEMYYLLSYIVYVVKGKFIEDRDSITEVLKTFDRNEINAGIKVLEENSRKYSILNLIDLASTYKPRDMSLNDIIQAIYQCPKGYIFSTDLMINMKRSFFTDKDIRISKIIPLVSSNEIIFEYIHCELFGVTHNKIMERLDMKERDQFLCIDSGKIVPFSKKSLYIHTNLEAMILSKRPSDTLFKHSVKYILDYLPHSLPVKIEKEENIVKNVSVRKAIPKSLKSKLWKQYFGNNMVGNCFCCKAEIEGLGGWEAGHILASALGGPDTIDNLRPICSTCNKSMGTLNMDIFKEKYFK